MAFKKLLCNSRNAGNVTHTKGPHSPVYCYSPSVGICHRLTQSNLYSWAADIVSFFFSFQVLLFLHIIGRGEGGCGSDAPFNWT